MTPLHPLCGGTAVDLSDTDGKIGNQAADRVPSGIAQSATSSPRAIRLSQGGKIQGGSVMGTLPLMRMTPRTVGIATRMIATTVLIAADRVTSWRRR